MLNQERQSTLLAGDFETSSRIRLDFCLRHPAWVAIDSLVSLDKCAGDWLTGLIIDDQSFEVTEGTIDFEGWVVIGLPEDQSQFRDPQFAGTELVVLGVELLV